MGHDLQGKMTHRACQRCEEYQPIDHFDANEYWNELCVWCLYNMPVDEFRWYFGLVEKRWRM